MLTKHRASPNSTDTSHRNSHQSINTSKTQLSNKTASQHPPTQSNNASNLHKLVQSKSTPSQNQHCNLHNCTPTLTKLNQTHQPMNQTHFKTNTDSTIIQKLKPSHHNCPKTFSFKKTKLTLS
ncbi:hypothetical protein KC19_12G095600 [Ceratodon purpureus]|uniref:Uncharacterized protein n=1 Tax=Ceratodon purpureus TaxID=3225 RepID=A0A8T0G611_CERPU|nr:hypothetical protein KC19_12G095600 [Ceratodon purpureus]